MWIIPGCLSRFLRRCYTSSLAELKRRPILATCMCICGEDQLHVCEVKNWYRLPFQWARSGEELQLRKPQKREMVKYTDILWAKVDPIVPSFKDKDIPIPNFQKLVELYFVYLKHQHRSKEFFQLWKICGLMTEAISTDKMSKLSSCAKVILIGHALNFMRT